MESRSSMRTLLALTFLCLTLFVFTACSGDRIFEPEDIMGDRDLIEGYDEELFMQHRAGVTYKDGTVLTKKGLYTEFALPKGFAYLNETNSSIIAADNGGKLLIKDKEGGKEQLLTLSSRVLSATIEDDILALVNVKNEMKVYALSTQKELYTFSGLAVMAIDVRLAAPYFYEGLIFFPTLDGKIQIYSKTSKKMIRTMSVSTQEQFNNIIFFTIADRNILAATGSEVYLFGKKSYKKELPVRDIFLSGDSVVVLRKDGRIASLGHDLEIMHEKKFPFAYFLGGLSKEDAIYVVEKEGYLLKLSKDFSIVNIYEIDFESEFFFVGDHTFYFSDGYLAP